MSNTTFQIKRSLNNPQPSGGTLQVGEIAYSYNSNVFFIGSSAGNDVLPIGGKFYVDKTNSSYTIAIAAYAAANSGTSGGAVYDKANSANYYAYLVDQNTAAAFAAENVTRAIAVAAYNNANSKFSSSGGTINGDVSVSGNLYVTGNTIWTNVSSFVVNDPLIYLAANNYVSDIVDIGFIANYVNATGSNVHTGVFRDAGSKEYYVFEGYNQEPINNVIDPTANGFTVSILNATLRTSNIIFNGINAYSWIKGSYDTANIAIANVNYVNTAMQAAFAKANSANYYAFLVDANATAAFVQANNVGAALTTANGIALAAFDKANAASAQAANADYITTGTLLVPYGGTGKTSFTSNGVVFGSGTGALQVTSAGTEGQVLQASAAGVPIFAMLDGGAF